MLVFKKIGQVLLLVILFVGVFFVAFPKERVYFGILEELDKHKVRIVSESMQSGLLGFELDRGDIYLSGANIAKVSNLSLGMFGGTIEDIRVLGSFESMVPKVDRIELSFVTPTFCSIEGPFGKVVGRFDIFTQTIVFKATIDQNSYNKYRQIFGQFKKKGEEYIYEYKL